MLPRPIRMAVCVQAAQRKHGRDRQPLRNSVVAEPSHVASADSVSPCRVELCHRAPNAFSAVEQIDDGRPDLDLLVWADPSEALISIDSIHRRTETFAVVLPHRYGHRPRVLGPCDAEQEHEVYLADDCPLVTRHDLCEFADRLPRRGPGGLKCAVKSTNGGSAVVLTSTPLLLMNALR